MRRLIAVLVACSGAETSAPLAEPGSTVVSEVELTMAGHRRGTAKFRLLENGKPMARAVELRIDIKHGKDRCILFGDVPATAFSNGVATVPVEVRTRTGGCGKPAEIPNPKIKVEIALPEERTTVIASTSLPIAKLVIPDTRAQPLPELETALGELGTVFLAVNTAEEKTSAKPCSVALGAEIDRSKPLEGVEKSVLEDLGSKGKPDYSKWSSTLFQRLGTYRKGAGSEPEKLLADLKATRHALVHAVREDSPPKIEADKIHFTPGFFRSVVYLVDLQAKTVRCWFPVVTRSSSVVQKEREIDDVRLQFDLEHRIVNQLRDSIELNLGKGIVPPDAPARPGKDPGSLQEVGK